MDDEEIPETRKREGASPSLRPGGSVTSAWCAVCETVQSVEIENDHMDRVRHRCAVCGAPISRLDPDHDEWGYIDHDA